MKKNLRIVSAAAAALLAVAPVAASAVSVNAQTINFNNNSTAITIAPSATVNATTVNVASNVTATAASNSHTGTNNGATVNTNTPSTISGSVTFSINGQSTEAYLRDGQVAQVYNASTLKKVDSKKLAANTNYYAELDNVVLNLGSSYYNEHSDHKVTIEAVDGTTFNTATAGFGARSSKITLDVDSDGHVVIPKLFTKSFQATDSNNPAVASFYEKSTGAQVSTGSVSVNASNGKLNVADVLNAIKAKYAAEESSVSNNGVSHSNISIATTAQDIANELRTKGITVASNGDFTPTSSFTVTAKSSTLSNGKSASMTVTVSVPNAPTAATESSVSKKIMSTSEKYDKNGNAKGSVYGLYDNVNLVTENGNLKVYTMKGNNFYKVAGEDTYVKVNNVTGRQKTVNIRSRQFKGNGKLATKSLIEKGSVVTVYGGKLNVAGHSMYRIGVGRYVKSANLN